MSPQVAPIEEALAAARFGAPHLVGNAAQTPRRALAGRCAAAVPGRPAAGPRYRLGRLAGRRRRSGHRAGPALLSARARRQAVQINSCRGIASQPAAVMMAWFSEWLARRHAGGRTAHPARCARGWPRLHGASFHRGWGEGEFETMLTERNTLVHRLRLGPQHHRLRGVAHGGRRSRNIVDRGRRQPSRPRPVPRSASDPSRPSRRPRRAHHVSRGRGK